MFQKNIPESVIQKVTGHRSLHRSLHSLRAYERISTSQHTEVSKVLKNNQIKSTSTSGMKSSTFPDLSGITVNNCSIGQININLNQNAQKSLLIVTQSFMLMKFHLIVLFTYKIHC